MVPGGEAGSARAVRGPPRAAGGLRREGGARTAVSGAAARRLRARHGPPPDRPAAAAADRTAVGGGAPGGGRGSGRVRVGPAGRGAAPSGRSDPALPDLRIVGRTRDAALSPSTGSRRDGGR